MRYIRQFWLNLKNQPDIWFFFGFLLTFSLSVRKILFYFPVKGTFNEYTAVYLYLSDVFLFLAIGSWLIILCYKSIKSSMDKLWITHLQHKLRHLSILLKKPYLYLPLLLVAWSWLSIIWADDKTISFFRSLKLLEFALLYIYLIFRFVPLSLAYVPRGTFLQNRDHDINRSVSVKTCSTWNKLNLFILIIASIQALIAIIQVFIQHSIGLLWLKESIISPAIPGVAKIVINGQWYIRAYGLFPHPNILGGFLVFSIIITLFYLKLFHMEHFAHSSYQGEDAHSVDEINNVPRGTIITLYIIIAIQLFALILTLSKSAIIALLIALAYTYVPRGTKLLSSPLQKKELGVRYECSTPACRSGRWNNSRIRIIVLCILILLVSAFIAFNVNINYLVFQSLTERMTYLNVSRGTILAHPIIGIGQGQFVVNMQSFSAQKLETWQYQPVHNVYLLIWSELGIIGLVIFLAFLYTVFQPVKSDFVPRGTKSVNGPSVEQDSEEIISRKSRGTKLFHVEQFGLLPDGLILSKEYFKYLQAILLGFIFLMFWDHYSWDIQQGQAILWILLGFMAGIKMVRYNKSKE